MHDIFLVVFLIVTFLVFVTYKQYIEIQSENYKLLPEVKPSYFTEPFVFDLQTAWSGMVRSYAEVIKCNEGCSHARRALPFKKQVFQNSCFRIPVAQYLLFV